MLQNRKDTLQKIGIDIYHYRKKDSEKNLNGDQPDVWKVLEKNVSSCQQCSLHESRTQTVFGVGDINADWLFIGEAPGKDEDIKGEPFVGRAGRLLNEIIFASGLSRESVFIANILKCRPPNNRDPKQEEVESCFVYLKKQIELINPKIIIAVGKIAAQQLLDTDQTMADLRGYTHSFGENNIPLVVIYHPAYLLRSPTQKSKVWSDILLAQDSIN